MPPVTRTISPHDLIWLSIKNHRDWEVMIVDDPRTYTIPRVIKAEFLKCLKITQRQYSNFWDDERLSYFEWRGYSLPQSYKLQLVIVNGRILGIQPFKPKKHKKETTPTKVILYPTLWKWKNWLAVIVSVGLIALYALPPIITYIVNTLYQLFR